MAKKKFIPEAVPVRRQSPSERVSNFQEVALGYDEKEAKLEAERCLQCKKKPCVSRCPVDVDIPEFVGRISDGDPEGALGVIKESNFLPGICGRVCPQEDQCEKECILEKKGEPLDIGKLERFAADWKRDGEELAVPQVVGPTGKLAAVVGSGPAGLTAAGELARRGHKVTIFEALHRPGGVLVYGIPEFRLPNSIVDEEIEALTRMGVELVTDFVVGKTASLVDILGEYNSVFLGIGAGLPIFLGIPAENLNGVYSANEYLTRCNLMGASKFPLFDTPVKKGGRVVVVGGGNVAMDSARTALRNGAKSVTTVYRRSRKEMPARIEEIKHGEEEGVKLRFLATPVEILGEEGRCVAVRCQEMELGEPDESGRRRPVPIADEYFTVEADTFIVAIGTRANPLLTSTVADLKLDRRGYVEVGEKDGATSIPGVFAGGDIVSGSATVIEAMGAGVRSALAMDRLMMRSAEAK